MRWETHYGDGRAFQAKAHGDPGDHPPFEGTLPTEGDLFPAAQGKGQSLEVVSRACR